MKKKVYEEEYMKFQDDVLKYIEEHPEHNEMIESHVKDKWRFRSMMWGKRLFDAWSQGKMEWYMNNSQVKYETWKG